MKEFKHFPVTDTCPVCQTNDDKPCLLIIIDGTQEGNIAQAIPVHSDCIELRYNRELKIFYQWL